MSPLQAFSPPLRALLLCWAGAMVASAAMAQEAPGAAPAASGAASAAAPDAPLAPRIALDTLPSQTAQVRVMQTVGSVSVNAQDVRANARIDEGARIVTGEGSSALLEMPDGSRITLMPRSVAELTRSRHYNAPQAQGGGDAVAWFAGKIRLIQGALEAVVHKVTPGAAPALEVETPTSLIGVRGTVFRVATVDPTVAYDRAEVVQGQVYNVNTWKNSQALIGQGQGAITNPNLAAITPVALLAAPVVGAPGQVLRRPLVQWRFNAMPGARAYRVIAADDAAMTRISFSAKSVEPMADLSALPNGTWHLRARGIDEQGLEGLDASTTVLIKQPAWELRGAGLYWRAGRTILNWRALTYAWGQPLPGASLLHAEVARTPDFARILASAQSNHPSQLELPLLPLGSYYLRLRLDNAALGNDEPQIYRFTVPGDYAKRQVFVLLENA